MPLSQIICPFCHRYVDLLDDRAELYGGEWWHADCFEEFEDRTLIAAEDEDDDDYPD